MPAHPVDKTGRRFGRLVVVKYHGNSQWLCKCDCGNTAIVFSSALNRGATQSCGCLHRERASKANITHGKSKTRLYDVWNGMKERCLNPMSLNYQNYGGRGITICDEWQKSFESFEKWAMENGFDPNLPFHKCSLDRIDNSKGYCPENCRWVTYSEQARNRRKCRKPNLWRAVEQIDQFGNVIGRYPSITDAAMKTGISRQEISGVCCGRRRITHGTRWRYSQPIVQTERQEPEPVGESEG